MFRLNLPKLLESYRNKWMIHPQLESAASRIVVALENEYEGRLVVFGRYGNAERHLLEERLKPYGRRMVCSLHLYLPLVLFFLTFYSGASPVGLA